MSQHPPVAVIGAGPYGLSIAAHLTAGGIEARVFGTPMQTWRESVPDDMLLKSDGFASSLSDPAGAFTLGHFCRERGIPYADTGWPVPVGVFAAYGEEFARRCVPGRDGRRVNRVARSGRGFRVELEDGGAVAAARVVMATGIGAFARVPDELGDLPPSVLTHSSRHANYAAFAGQAVAVIGAGASALDAAAALRRAGAAATLVTRRSKVRFYDAPPPRRPVDAILSPMTPLGAGWKKWIVCEAPMLFHLLPERLRLHIVRHYLGPSPARFVRDTIEGHVPYRLNSRVVEAALEPDGRVALTIERDERHLERIRVDHVVAATGYKVELHRLGILAPSLMHAVDTVDGSPVLSRSFESSVPGLYFAGTAAAYSFGPMFRFACGADYAARRLTRHVLGGERASRPGAGPAGAAALQPGASRG